MIVDHFNSVLFFSTFSAYLALQSGHICENCETGLFFFFLYLLSAEGIQGNY